MIRRPSAAEDWATIEPSDFVEIRGRLLPNPLAATLKMLTRLLPIVKLSTGLETGDKVAQGGKKKENKAVHRQLDQINEFLESLVKDLGSGSVETFVMEASELPNHRVVLSLFGDYLRDRSTVSGKQGASFGV